MAISEAALSRAARKVASFSYVPTPVVIKEYRWQGGPRPEGQQTIDSSYSQVPLIQAKEGGFVNLELTEGVWHVLGFLWLLAPELTAAWAAISRWDPGTEPPESPDDPMFGDNAWAGVGAGYDQDSALWSTGQSGFSNALHMASYVVVPEGETRRIVITAGCDDGGPITIRSYMNDDVALVAVRVGDLA